MCRRWHRARSILVARIRIPPPEGIVGILSRSPFYPLAACQLVGQALPPAHHSGADRKVGRRNRLPHQLQVILRRMNRQDRGGGFRLSLTAKGFAADARQDPGGMPVSRERFLAGFACIGGTGFSLSTPACGRIFSHLLREGSPVVPNHLVTSLMRRVPVDNAATVRTHIDPDIL